MRIAPPAAALAALLAATAAPAQVPDRAVGLGVSLNPATLVMEEGETTLMLPVGFGNIYLPIIGGPHLKIEPEFGIWHTSSSTSASTYSSSYSSTLLRVGVGVFSLARVGGGTALYIGPRAAIVRSSSESSSSGGTEPTKWHQTNYVIGLAAGGEHFFSPHLSLGAEVQFNYVKVGQAEHEPDYGTAYATTRTSMISNNGLLFIRLYR